MTSQITELPKLTIIVGAGASHDVANEGTHKEDKWRPPLAAELFRINKREVFEPLLREYPGAAALVDRLAPLAEHYAEHNPQDFKLEEKLRAYADHRDVRIRQQFKEIPAYIRAVIVECSKNYVARPACFHQLVAEVLAEHEHQVLFLVLNYDTFVERALGPFGHDFRRITDYIDPDRRAKVVKVHGSVDWFFEFVSVAANWHAAIRRFDVGTEKRQFVVHPDLADKTDFAGFREFVPNHLPHTWRYPVLTAPLAGKGPTDLVCPAEHLVAAKEFLRDCKKFLVLGTSGGDKDLFELLDSATPPVGPHVAQFVGRQDVKVVEQRYRDKVRAFRSARVESYSHGFRKHMLDPAFPEFLTVQIP